MARLVQTNRNAMVNQINTLNKCGGQRINEMGWLRVEKNMACSSHQRFYSLGINVLRCFSARKITDAKMQKYSLLHVQ